MRIAHFLKGNKNNETIHNAIFFDTETDPFTVSPGKIQHRLRFGMASYVRRESNNKWTIPKWFSFHTREEYYAWMFQNIRRKSRLYVFCHNTNFDLPVMGIFTEMRRYGWTLRKAIIEAPPTLLEFRKDDRTILFLDTLNFFRMPLKDLGKRIGLPKLEMPNGQCTAEEWGSYCKRDVEIIMVAIQRWSDFLISENLGGFAATLASQSYRTYRHRFMFKPIGIHTNESALKLERASYKGGRNECFRLGTLKGKWFLLDVNSMYPAVMRARSYPSILSSYTSKCTVQGLALLMGYKACTARVTLNSDIPAYPIQLKGKLCFPVGEFETVLSTPEIAYALARNHIKEVKELACYKPAELFKDFVNYMYNKRIESEHGNNQGLATNYKTLLNSLYGKFGQRGFKYVTDMNVTDNESKVWIEVNYQTGKIKKYRKFSGLLQSQEGEQESRESFPAIAAHVTAYARMYLWELIEQAGRGNVAYCDTDSLLVNGAGFRNLHQYMDPLGLGKLKLEATYTNVCIRGCKDYTFGDKTKTKGIRKEAVKIGENEYEQDKWSSLKGLLRAGNMEAPTTEKIKKTLKRVYDKGTVDRRGFVHPLILSP